MQSERGSRSDRVGTSVAANGKHALYGVRPYHTPSDTSNFKGFPLVWKGEKGIVWAMNKTLPQLERVAEARARKVTHDLLPSVMSLVHLGMGACLVFSGNSKLRKTKG